MEEKKKKIRKPASRRLVQLYAALLYNANLKGFIDGHIYTGNLKAACVPGLNCYSCPGAVAGCPLGALQNALNAAGHTAPWYILGILALFGVILGRTVCGWLCPLGLIQELLHRIPTFKIRKSSVTRKLSYLKYVILAVFVIGIPLIYGVGQGVILPGFCKYICPAGTLEGAVGLLQNPVNSSSFFQLGQVFTSKWVIMVTIGLACIFCYRSFCRFICPLGAIYGFFNRFSLVGVKVNPDRCNGCGACVAKCPMDIRHVGDHECISCAKCMDVCTQGAISLKCGKITLKGPETGKNADPEPVIQKRKKAGRIAWGIAVAVLVFAVGWFNLIEPAIQKNAPAGTAAAVETRADPEGDTVSLTVGTETGNLAPDFSTELLSGETFRLSEYRGRVVILNFWATTCAPCIEELPYYEQLKAAYPDVEILAVHNTAGAKKAKDFLAGRGWDHLDFALDSREKGILRLLNASDAMPQTIILNRQGVVTYNAQAPLTYEKLEELYLAALADQTGAQPAETVPEALPFPAGEQLPEIPAVPAEEQQDAAGAYLVTVLDQEGNPVAGVTLGFCTDTACRNSSPSDENGRVTMNLAPEKYHIAVIDVPEGYELPGDMDLYMGPESGESTLLVSRKEEAEAAPAEESGAESIPEQQAEAQARTPEEILGMAFPDFTFTDTEGKTAVLSQVLKEKEVVFISLFASWCGPCRQEFPEMEKIYQKYQDKMAFFALSAFSGDTMETMRNYRETMNLSFRFGLEAGTGILDFVSIDGYPTNILIDRFGNVGYAKSMSIPDEHAFERLVASFMGEKYTATAPLPEIPDPVMDVAYPDEKALSDAVNAEGSTLVFASDPEGKNFPFLPETREGKSAAVASGRQLGTVTSMHTAFTAEEGDVLTFCIGAAYQSVCQGLTVRVDGENVRKLCGSYDWKTILIPLTAGKHEVVFENNILGPASEEEWLAVGQVRLLTGEEAKAALENAPVYPRAEESSLEIVNPGVRKAVILYQGSPIEVVEVVEEDKIRAAITITEEADPELALTTVSTEDGMHHIADLPYEEGAYRVEYDAPAKGYAYVLFGEDPLDPDREVLSRMCVKGEENIQSILDEYLAQLGENGADDLTWMYLDELLAREEGE